MKQKLFRILAIFALLSLAGGCAYTPHDVSMTATAPIYSTEIGSGSTIGLRFIDDRDSKTVGQRAVGMTGADISANNIGLYLEDQLEEIFKRNGFEVVDYNDATGPKVTISLRTFKFFIEQGFWTGANNVDVSMKADARNDNGDYLKNYSYTQEERIVVIPDASGIDAMMNAALSDVLTKLSVDADLMKFLAR